MDDSDKARPPTNGWDVAKFAIIGIVCCFLVNAGLAQDLSDFSEVKGGADLRGARSDETVGAVMMDFLTGAAICGIGIAYGALALIAGLAWIGCGIEFRGR